VFASHKLNDKVSLGIAVFSPFGLATEYDDNWIGRFAGIKSEVMTVNVNPTLAVKPNEKFSLGVGVSGQYVEAELTQALSPQVPGAIGKIKGDDYAFGFNLGAQYALTDTTMAGVSFRSKVDHELEGDASFSGVLPKSDVTADLETPEIVSFGLSQEICKSWKVFGDVTWTGWSTFEELRVNYKDGRPDTVNFENWDDTWRFSLGTEYAFSEKWVGRMGVAWDESPVPDAEHRTVRIPCSDRTWLAFGLGYQPSEQWLIDAGFMWVWFEDVRINNEYAPGARVVGDFEGEAQVYSLQARYKF
jgi:long-chain fatty acid transport protein